MKTISTKEYQKIQTQLAFWVQDKSIVAMWTHGGKMVFSDEFDTAALEIHEGKFRINANPRFWKKLNRFEKLFVICHEFLHVMLGHWLTPKGNMDPEWVNIAQDIQVNEFIRSNYPYTVTKMKSENKHAWISTVFKDKAHLVKRDQDFTYYYKLMMKCLK